MKYLLYSSIPFEHEKDTFPDERTIVEKNLFWSNVGNMFFFNAIVRSLLSDKNQLARHSKGTDVNSFDAAILIHANTLREGAEPGWFESDYNSIKNSNIPFVLVCVGSDSDHYFRTVLPAEIIESAKRCYGLLLERSVSIGVRGEMTKRVMVEQVGIPEERIDVIGCPSVRYFGKFFDKHPHPAVNADGETVGGYKKFSDKMKIAVNFTGYHYDTKEAVYLYRLLNEYKNSYIIFTDKEEAELLWYGTPVSEGRRHDLLPTTPDNFIIKEGRARFNARQDKIMNMLRTFDFSIGSRIHQAIISILSGTPAILIAHSLRVLEIAQYHHIPYILRSELVEEQPSVEALYYRACLGMQEFYDSYDKGLKEYTDFLQKNNLVVNEDFLI